MELIKRGKLEIYTPGLSGGTNTSDFLSSTFSSSLNVSDIVRSTAYH